MTRLVALGQKSVNSGTGFMSYEKHDPTSVSAAPVNPSQGRYPQRLKVERQKHSHTVTSGAPEAVVYRFSADKRLRNSLPILGR